MPGHHVFSHFEAAQCAWRSMPIAFLIALGVVVGTVQENCHDEQPLLAAAPGTETESLSESDTRGPPETSAPPEAPPETAALLRDAGRGLQHGMTDEVKAFADGLYIGATFWEIPSPTSPMSSWKVVFSNRAATPMLDKDMDACLGQPVLSCFPEMDNEPGLRYGELARLALATRRLVHVGATEFAQHDGRIRVYYNAISYVDDTHVAVLYHVLAEGTHSARGKFQLGLRLSEEQKLDVQIRVLSDVAAAVDRQLDHQLDSTEGAP